MVHETVKSILNNELCTGCGICSSTCPKNAITMKINQRTGIYIPQLEDDKCVECGICYDVCPGYEVNLDQLNSKIFGKQPDNILIGNYLNCYIGHSTDCKIQYSSSSGGAVTQLLIFALEEGIINGVLVTKMKKDKPLEPEPFIARTKEEVIEASRSKYCPVPLNEGLKEILESDKNEKFAVVGLPCHIQGLRKAMEIKKEFKQKIVLSIGIFCNHTPNFWATKLLLQKHKIREDRVMTLEYRGNGWPGFMTVSENRGNEKKEIKIKNSWKFIGSHFFYPKRCLMCSDATCELCDISCGDAWLPELSDNKVGISLIIARTEYGKQILETMISKNKIRLSEVNSKKVIQSQLNMIYFKKKNLSSRKQFLKPIPKYCNLLESDRIDYLLALFPLLNYKLSYNLSSKPLLRKLLVFTPEIFISIYSLPYKIISSKKAKKDLKKYYDP